jgi:FkbM family methyltransferase
MSRIKKLCEIIGVDKIIFVDIGARSGIPKRWMPLENKLEIIGFEPDTEECKNLTEEYAKYSMKSTFYPVALLESTRRAYIYNCVNPAVDSCYEPNSKLWARYTEGEIYAVTKKTEISATTLDEILEKNRHTSPNFIKIDVQGAELAAIQGARKAMSKCFAVEVEVEFTSLYQNQPLFSDIDSELRNNGFTFFDFRDGQLHHETRLTKFPGMLGTGQLIAANAVYFKDYINTDTIPTNPGISIICCLAYEKYDYAIELLYYYQEKGIYDLDSVNEIEGIIRKFGSSGPKLVRDKFVKICFQLGKFLIPSRFKPYVLRIMNFFLRDNKNRQILK